MMIPANERIISFMCILYSGSTEDSTNNQTLPSKQRHIDSRVPGYLMGRSCSIRIGRQ